jgi:PGF-pre-PGF domain-containing protein
MKALTEIAGVGLFKKVSYKFIRENYQLNRIELRLYDSQLKARVNEEDLAKSSASKFVHQFSPGKEYEYIDVWLINRVTPSNVSDAIFSFQIKELSL